MSRKKLRLQDINILVADDDPVSREVITQGLLAENYTVFQAADGQAALEICQQRFIDLAILDYGMEPDGITIAKLLKRIYDHPNFLFISSYNEPEIVEKAAASGALTYLVKPVLIEQLRPSITTAFKRAKEFEGLRRNLNHTRAFTIASALTAAQYNMFISAAEETVRLGARSRQMKLSQYAQSIIDDFENKVEELRRNSPVNQQSSSVGQNVKENSSNEKTESDFISR